MIIFSLKRQYPPLTLQQLQLMIDTNRVDSSKPIDLTALSNTGIWGFDTRMFHAGVHLTIDVSNIFLDLNINKLLLLTVAAPADRSSMVESFVLTETRAVKSPFLYLLKLLANDYLITLVLSDFFFVRRVLIPLRHE